MTIKPTLYWNDKIVMAFLIQAASIHRRLPEVRTPGYYSFWPVVMRDEWERLCELVNARSTLGSPMPPEVTFQDEVMEWMRLLNRDQQHLVWARANRIPWKVLVEEFDRSKVSLWRDLNGALQSLVSHLNRKDVRGEHFRALRNRTHTCSWPGETP